MTARTLDFAPNYAELLQSTSAGLEEYGRFQQHLGLLEDPARVSTYLEAVRRARGGDLVVDVGAGTGVWAIAALKLGYKRAILIEPSRKIGLYARHLADLNGVANRVTIIPSRLEDLPTRELPSQIDLIVTETISSAIFGFGSWDALPDLTGRLHHADAIIPIRGRLFASLAPKDFSTRGPGAGGLAHLQQFGLAIDLFDRTFRSGGNVYDKRTVVNSILSGELQPNCLAHFDFLQSNPLQLAGAPLQASRSAAYSGVVLHWEIDLASGKDCQLSSLDPNLTSWYPLYIPFISPITLSENDWVHVRLKLLPIDRPYKYAFQIWGDAKALSHILYW